jgi:hypothetical protein
LPTIAFTAAAEARSAAHEGAVTQVLTMLQRINGSRKVAIILHQEHSTPGRLGRLLEMQGFDLDIRRPRFGDPLPKTLAEYAGAIIFGGPMSANDEEDWLRREIECRSRKKSPSSEFVSGLSCWRAIWAARSIRIRKER